ncbi:uncharacterized protein LOC112900738 [Panicum hallii]|uniref:uncharacterized protein LOC112900738 n=1 Tax=Panicum hallii TaxID=206008 RepID=UPI000DF4EA32|nr:uncharacterized protein LOC112900738 [Panicum hallii]
MASLGPWVGVPPDLLRFIRGVCTAWRSALPAAAPLLLTVSGPDAPRHRQIQPGQLVSASFLMAGRSFHLSELPTGGEFVGSSNGWIAVDPIWFDLFPLRNDDDEPVLKVVFAPNPRPTTTPPWRSAPRACSPTRDMRWTVMDVAMAEQRDKLADLVYDAGGGKVYCVTAHGDVHVFHVPGCRRRRPRVAPLHANRAGGLFAPPYDTASKLTGAKSIFLSGGSLHQAWRNTTIAFSSMTPGGGRFSMAKDEIVVLKYDPERRPCWDALADLGGRSVFVGKNNPVVLRPEDASGVRPNCVYWIDERSRFQPMVFDMATITSTPHPFDAEAPGPARRPLCWFFLNDKISH